ncbi:hypothetical protein [Colwellia psychrerythraea]|uniref:Putative lipoprotein n=1 Tax=Colwellia psychrerythraea (strain 34H / ATCC BAA-681) TaxID=167879 RepID=Q485H6_COLP3|nr:hypothetical protein [Colwellia psychrerythraea]AAZ26476.1 putative lipoprotein [Colwellia psychrerythraea 34H]
MKVFKIAVCLLCFLVLGACSNTAQVEPSSENNHYFAKEFSHNEFITYQKDSVKKSASSDHELMLSLLNRPMPEDQRMMLAFAQRQANYFPDSTIIGVQIKGDKKNQNISTRTRSQYAQTIAQDINAVTISALPK